MKDLWIELRPRLGAIAAFSFFINLLYLAPAIFMMQVFDRVIPSNSGETLVVLLFGTGIALLIFLLLDYVRHRLQNVLGSIIDERLSPPVVNAIVACAARSPQGVRSDGMRDVATLRTLFSANGLVALFDAPWAVIYIAVIWLFHPVLGIGAACATLLMLCIAWLNDRLSRDLLEELQSKSRRAVHYVDSSLRNAEILQALGMTTNLLSRWRELQDRMAGTQSSASRRSAIFMAITKTLRQAIQIGLLALGAYLVLAQHASAGIMIATTILLGRAVQPVEQLVSSWRLLIEARSAHRRLSELSRHFEPQEARVNIAHPEGALTVDSLSFRAPRGDKPILLNISFSMAAGEALAILGPSAAGKSTLARLLTGVWAPATGTVRLDGADVSNWPRESLGPLIGYVPQDVELFDGTVADNIARLGEVNSEAVIEAATRANAHTMILALDQGYDTPVGEGGSRLSPGQRQRVALARALYGDPRLVILDEPNANLDGAGEIALAQAMSGLRTRGITSIVVTHRPSLIAHVDKILTLDSGRIQKFGPAAEVMKALQQQAQVITGGRAA